MKPHPFAPAFLIAWLANILAAGAHELPLFGPLPKLDKGWVVHTKGSNKRGDYETSWMVFTHPEDGVLSFFATKIGDEPVPKPTLGGPWTEMPISNFPGGYPAWDRPADLHIKHGLWGSSKLVTVESTTYWEEESGALHLAHGFTLRLGELWFQVQHTSKKIITPELANDMVRALVRLQVMREGAQRDARDGEE